jgi:hypothetical protein
MMMRTKLENLPGNRRRGQDTCHGVLIPLMDWLLRMLKKTEKEEGDGGDSDIEGEDRKEFEEAAVEAMEEKIQDAADDSNAVVHTEKKCKVLLSGNNNNFCLPSPPEAWLASAPKSLKGEPAVAEVDNPGSWCQYTCRAEFDSKGQYKHHVVPTGAMPVPLKDWDSTTKAGNPPLTSIVRMSRTKISSPRAKRLLGC